MTNSLPPDLITTASTAWEAFLGAVSAVMIAVAAAGRAYHAWKNDSGIVKSLLFGTNTPTEPTKKP